MDKTIFSDKTIKNGPAHKQVTPGAKDLQLT